MRNQISPILVAACVTVLGVAALVPRPSGEGTPGAERRPAAAEAGPAAVRQGEDSAEPAGEQPGTDFVQPLEEFVGKSIPYAAGKNYRIPDEYHVESLIAIVHDPFDSSSGYRFDTIVNAIQRALEREHFILDRFWFPWRPRGDGAPAADTWQLTADLPPPPETGRSPGTPRAALRIQKTSDVSASRQGQQPGVLLFRKGPGKEEKTELLMVFLVGDTATKGLNKKALATSLQFIADARLVTPGNPVRILGPGFSGSQTALAVSLRDWARSREGKNVRGLRRFRIVSGAATAFDPTKFESDCRPAEVSFRATIIPEAVVMRELLQYVWRPKARVALLRETNTGFGQASAAPTWAPGKDGARPPILEIPFPLHISRVRTAYGKDRPGKSSGLPSLPSFVARLHIPVEKGPEPHDTEPTLAPEMTVAYSERVLGMILSTIARERVQYVAILATDVKDMIFLAKVIRENAPDVQLLFAQSDVLLSHPDYSAYLRGALVASTYPLYTGNQRWSNPFQGEEWRCLFPGHVEQGYYNATIALLEGQAEKDPGEYLFSQQLLEYGPPFDARAGEEVRPPVWISILGQDGPHPVAIADPRRKFKEAENNARQARTAAEQDRAEKARQEAEDNLSAYTQYVLPAVNWPPPGGHFQFRHTRLWVWALVIAMALLGALVGLYGYGWLAGPRDGDTRSGGTFVELWQERDGQFRRRQQLYSIACFVPWAAFWGYVTAISLIPYFARLWSRPGLDIELYYFVIPVLALLTLAGLVLATAAAVVRGLAAPPTEAEAGVSGVQRYSVLAILGALALWVVGRHVYYAAWGLDRPTSIFALPESALFFFERSTNLADGVSPVLPAFCLALALFWWGLTNLRRLNRLEKALAAGAGAALGGPPADPGHMRERLLGKAREIWRIAGGPDASDPSPPRPLVGPWLASAFCRLHSRALLWWVTRLQLPNPPGRAPGADPDPAVPSVPAEQPDAAGQLHTLASEVGAIVRSPESLGPFPSRPRALLAGLVAAFCRLHSGALVWWATRLRRANPPRQAPAADPDPAAQSGTRKRLVAEAEKVWEIVRSPHALRPFRPRLLVVWIGLAFAFCRLHSGFIPTVEGTLFDGAVQFGFAAVTALLVFTFLHTLELWHRLRRLLQLVAQLPLLQAFDRMPARVPSLFGPYLSSSSSDRESHLAVGLQQLRALAEQYVGARPSLGQIVGGAGRLAALDLALGYDEKEFRQQMEDHWDKAGPAERERPHYRQEAEATVARERARHFLREGQPFQDLCRQAGRACVDAIDGTHPTLSVGEAFGPARAAAEGEGTPVPAGEKDPTADNPLPRWFRLAEDYLAIETVNWLSHFFAQLRNLVTFLVVGSILLVLAVILYPFQPERLLLFFVAGLALVFALGILRVFFQIERDEVISRILKTTPNRITLNPVFLSHVGTYVVPLLGVLAASSMDASNLLHTLLDPLYQALK
jgi:hypothetical protein